jgi:predicted DCC family thiol-disulfide oxidoreductase YuxK
VRAEEREQRLGRVLSAGDVRPEPLPFQRADALQLIAADGTTWQGAAAIEKLLDVLPKGWFISWIFKIPFARTLADRFYKWFARNRYKLGCGAHCQSRPLDVIWAEAEKAR